MVVQSELTRLRVANDLTLELGTILDLDELSRSLCRAAAAISGFQRVILLRTDHENNLLRHIASFPPPATTPGSRVDKYEHTISGYNLTNDPIIGAWLRGQRYDTTASQITPDSPLWGLTPSRDLQIACSVPLWHGDQLIGVLIADNPGERAPLKDEQCQLLEALAPSAAIALKNATLHSQTLEQLAQKMHELNMLRQIDRELSDTIELAHVFDMTLDWALRFTNAQAASLALYDEPTDTLRFVSELGYEVTDEGLALIHSTLGGGITHRVARSSYAEVIPDVSLDNDHVPISNLMQSCMSVPVMREDRVIAVMTLESKKLNAFTEEHLDFVEKLSARAGVAIDNARLYAEAVREREKLSHILRDIVDIVIVVGYDERIVLINQSALAALELNPDEDYAGQSLTHVLRNHPLMAAFRRAKAVDQMMVEEVKLPSSRTYYANLSPHTDVGWIIVMHDITPLKETDQLKSELVATVSHDLKQPLSVMNGYVELLQMQHQFDEIGNNFINTILRSIQSMRQLIDDVLDLAKIESGIHLQMQAVPLSEIIDDCIRSVHPLAEAKALTIETNVASALPELAGEYARMKQIFVNLIGNAVKYTPTGGRIEVRAEPLEGRVRVAIEDDGYGISPADQTHIFDRFFRVRRPETDSIEGTGLGLAIVKSLVEAHNGQIGLESVLGEGTIFYVTLPVFQK